MIRLFFLCLIITVLGLWLTLFLGFYEDPGYILIAFGSYTFETSLFALLISLVVVYLVLRILKLTVNWIDLPRFFRVKELYKRKLKDRAKSAATEGYIQLYLGNWTVGHKLLKKILRTKDASIIDYLAASYATFKIDELEKWSRYLDEAKQKFPTHASTIEIMRAQFLLDAGQFDEAKQTLDSLRRSTSQDPRLMFTLKDYYLQIGEWKSLKALLIQLEKKGLIKPEELHELTVKCVKSEIEAHSEKVDSGEHKETVESLTAFWRHAPNRLRTDEGLIKVYASNLIRFGANRDALKVIEKALANKWNDQLVCFYGEKDFKENSHQLATAERWLKTVKDSSVLFLTLARISLRNELMEKAKNYYELSITSSPSAEAYLELSLLLARLGEDRACLEKLKLYFKIVAAGKLDLPLVS